MNHKKKRTNPSSFNPIKGSWVFILLIVVVFPTVWIIVDGTNWFTQLGIRGIINQEPSAWTSAFLGYFASALAAVAGYFAVLITIYKQEESRHEDKRKEVLPLIEVKTANKNTGRADISKIITNIPISDTNLNPSNGAILELKNVGMREMYDVVIANVMCNLPSKPFLKVKVAPIIYKNSSTTIRLQPVMVGKFDPEVISIIPKGKSIVSAIEAIFSIEILYKDCYNNLYQQRIKISSTIDANILESNDDTSITYDQTRINNIGLLSAPKLMKK